MPNSIQWESKYSIHHAGIDAEHQRLFSLANDLLAISVPQREPQRFKADVKELFRHLECHFRHEEQLMEKIGYPDREAHIAKHKVIAGQLNSVLRDSVNLPQLAKTLRRLLVEWLVHHIGEEDAKITSSVDRYTLRGAS